jgi:hypothetical protein
MDYRDDIDTVFQLGRQSRHDSAVPSMTEGHGLQMRRRNPADAIYGETPMRAVMLTAVMVASCIAGTAFAQRSVHDQMNEMKAKYPQSFESCQALATSRGYRLSDGEYEARAVMMFIEGCIMGRQR